MASANGLPSLSQMSVNLASAVQHLARFKNTGVIFSLFIISNSADFTTSLLISSLLISSSLFSKEKMVSESPTSFRPFLFFKSSMYYTVFTGIF